MGNKQSGGAFVPIFLHAQLALVSKCLITHGKDLIQDQDVWFPGGGDREPQTRYHATGICPQGKVDKSAKIGKLDDVWQAAIQSLGLECPSRVPLRKMFSRPVSSG